jgi:hypothetical protein|tara:strand:+ start:249 stop:1082 length:834 start_codon:yes stop_codon:yes gene_type:complete
MILEYTINDNKHSVEATDGQEFKFGKDEILSNASTDITSVQNWYSEGHTSLPFLWNEQFEDLKKGITKTIKNIAEDIIGKPLDGFTLENYHKYVTSNEEHFKVVSKTRDLYSYSFGFPIKDMIPKFEALLGFKLTDRIPDTDIDEHIIVRINRPKSNDYNPPHKDMYEGYDNGKNFQFLNFWVPIAGVTDKTSLPIAPKSHRIPENKILRTIDGGKVGSNSYRVVLIKEWDGSSDLVRAKVDYSQVLMFSSHMIHGLAINEEEDVTRVALEFRLFKK